MNGLSQDETTLYFSPSESPYGSLMQNHDLLDREVRNNGSNWSYITLVFFRLKDAAEKLTTVSISMCRQTYICTQRQ